MKKVLVTGATGFIGNHVINQLLQKNYEVVASSSSIDKAKLKNWFASVKYIPLDLAQFDKGVNYASYFDHPDHVIHLAWEGLPNYKASFHVEKNLPRHFAFLENLTANGVTDLTVTGTCFEYGMQEGCLAESLETFPANSYAVAKDTLRKRLEILQQKTGFRLKWVRLFYMYGTGQNPNSLLSQLDQALAKAEAVFNMSGGEQQRDYLPVEQVAANILDIALQANVTGVINCCSGTPVKVKDFVENYLNAKQATIKLNLGYYPYADYEPMNFWGDDKKLNSIKSNNE
ncbi:MAG: NAD(P)-dependent oxidoreductase [Bacteroidota bacterium]